jgi:hypothetical protein
MIPPTFLNGIEDIAVVLGLITDGSQRCPDVIDAIDASNMFQFFLQRRLSQAFLVGYASSSLLRGYTSLS